MAITKLMHIKEQKRDTSAGLKNCIRYILNPAKTKEGLLVGGNSGNTADEIVKTMLSTKEEWGKTSGRQGYHFVISFPPGETDASTCLSVARDFCEAFFGDGYDYCYAVHDDTAHMHAHIVFNSVSRLTGLKYHYSDGDWIAKVQPVTDMAAQKHGLPALSFDESKPKGLPYPQWEEARKGSISEMIRADIDEAIEKSDSLEECISRLEEKYRIRFGKSEKVFGRYFTLFSEEMGMKKAKRNYSLGRAYTTEAIRWRILRKRLPEKMPSPRAFRILTIHWEPERIRRTWSRKQKYYLSFHWRIRRMQRIAAGGMRGENREVDRLLKDMERAIKTALKNPLHPDSLPYPYPERKGEP